MGSRAGLLRGVVGILLGWAVGTMAAERPLEVVQGAPVGEVRELKEVDEIRVLFSEPMVALGKIPEPVTAPFFTIEPPLKGSFRWSGTRLLLFNPDEPEKLPYATTYTVTVKASAATVEGKKLGKPYRFSFTTPTVRLRECRWYRKGDRYDSPVVVGFRFNQSVSPAAVAAHATAAFRPHDWQAPSYQKEVLARLALEDPKAFMDFQMKVMATLKAAKASGPVSFKLATTWDEKRFPKTANWVVFETEGVPPPESWIRAQLDGKLPSLGGPELSGARDEYTLQLEKAFFVDGLECADQCSVEFWNGVNYRTEVFHKDSRGAVKVWDITEEVKGAPLVQKAPPIPESEEGEESEEEDGAFSRYATFDRLGFSVAPARSYLVKVDKGLKSADGQVLGYTWLGKADYWHKSSYTSFGEGHGVWEKSSGNQLPFYARNLLFVDQWCKAVTKEELLPAALRVEGYAFPPKYNDWGGMERTGGVWTVPQFPPRRRDLHPDPDVLQNYGFDLKEALNPEGTGVAWLGLKKGDAIPRSVPVGYSPFSATLVQVTNLGLTVKDSPVNTLVWVTSLDKGEPVTGAEVEIRSLENKVVWSGTTTDKGVALAPDTATLRVSRGRYAPQFIVVASKGRDLGYCMSDWSEGLSTWEFGVSQGAEEAKPLLRGDVFADRGVYKLGEEVHLKLVARLDTPTGMILPAAGKTVSVKVRDNRDGLQDERTLTLSEWGSADWAFTLPKEAPLGNWSVVAEWGDSRGALRGSFLVAAYRKPDFRVDATLLGAEAMAGETLKGVVTGRYLFGAPMAGREIRWTYTGQEASSVPEVVEERFPGVKFLFLQNSWYDRRYWNELKELGQKQEALDGEGALRLDLSTDKTAGIPMVYALEGEVTDLSRQTISGRSSFTVHPAPWYLGLKDPGFFADTKTGVKSQVVAVTPQGAVAEGVDVQATLTQLQWISVRRAEGEGMYTWESELRKKEVWKKTLVTGKEPVALEGPLPEGGVYLLSITARDGEGRFTTTDTEFYAMGSGYTAWERYDHNRIDLIPEKKNYKPGETARILIKSPWEKATALLTVEREGIKSHEVFDLTSTQQTVSIPITEENIPNLFVSVVLVRGRVSDTLEKDGSDPGKPAFRVGYCELKVENRLKRLSVKVGSNKEEYRPAEEALFTADLKDADGKPVVGEVTLWAVDYGVLSLTGYKTPDLLPSVWVPKGLSVNNEDSRQRIVSRRVLTPKGADEGGGGGYEPGSPGQIRKDFRVLAVWAGSAIADAQGHVAVKCTLPESLTTFRIMAVAHDKSSRFGWGEREIRISKPLLLTPAFPRFLVPGDKALAGAVLHSLLKEKGTALVSLKSLDPGLLAVAGEGVQQVALAAKGSAEVRFPLEAKGIGSARLLMTAKVLGEEDAFELTLPVKVVATPETVAAYGTVEKEGKEIVELPAGVVPDAGGLRVELSSTALVGLGEGADYLVTYPYGCAEQRSSCALGLMLASDLGGAFHLPGIEAGKLKEIAQATLKELELYQCENGGFVYWKGSPCHWASPYLTAYVLHVYQRGQKLGYKVNPVVLQRGYDFLLNDLVREKPLNEGYMPYYTSWQSFACKVLAEGGQTVDSHLTRLYGYRDRMPAFALAHLWDALVAAGEKGARPEELSRRLHNAILPEGGSAHVEEGTDASLVWCWSSNARSTAIVLGSLVRNQPQDALAEPTVRWLMKTRKQGRWNNTQENAWAMGSLVDYYRKYEKEVPDFSAVVTFGLQELMKAKFQGRDTEVRTHSTPMATLLGAGKAGEQVPLIFKKEGTGKLHYATHLKYVSLARDKQAMDQGFEISRSYALPGGGPVGTIFQAGQLIEVTLKIRNPKQRNWVAVTDPIPAGFEAVESWFATTARDLAQQTDQDMEENQEWMEVWERGGFDHVERHDDRVLLFATRLSEGEHVFRYVCRATTAGTFHVESVHAEEMYEPEVFGRSATTRVEVKP